MPESERIPLLASALGQIRVKGWSTGFCWNLHAAARDGAIPGSSRITTHLSRHCIDMPTQRALRAVGMATLQLPRALRRRGCRSILYVAGRNARCPVLLVHGYAASEPVWTPLRRALAGGGFGHIASVTSNLLIPGCGHLTIRRDVRLIRSLVRELIHTETFAHADAVASAGASREPMAA